MSDKTLDKDTNDMQSPSSLERGETLLEVRHLWKVFGKNEKDFSSKEIGNISKEELQEKTGMVMAIRDVSFEVKKGEFFVLMGLSGSGKSTTIRNLIRLIEPTEGEILFQGEDIARYNTDRLADFRKKHTGMVFQHFGLFPHFTVLDNAAYGLKVQGLSKEERYEKAEKALETVGLKGWENYYPETLSGGMQQRVGLARALANDPDILLMDEPFSGLDPLIRREMQDELADLQSTLHKTIIFVTHDLHEALKMGDRIAIMRDGQVVQLGTPEDVITSPADDYVKAFVQDASPARVLTAENIMEEPETLLYRWEGAKTARTILKKEKKEWAYVVDAKHNFLGIAQLDDIDKVIKKGEKAFTDIIISDMPTCTKDQVVEDLFALATKSPYPIPVVDENNRLSGVVPTRTIFDSITQHQENEQEEENDV